MSTTWASATASRQAKKQDCCLANRSKKASYEKGGMNYLNSRAK